jgi:hypothetical protein
VPDPEPCPDPCPAVRIKVKVHPCLDLNFAGSGQKNRPLDPEHHSEMGSNEEGVFVRHPGSNHSDHATLVSIALTHVGISRITLLLRFFTL